MKKITAIAALAAALLFPAIAAAQDEDENQLFQDTNSVVATSNVVSSGVLSNAEGNALTFSGSLMSRTTYSMNKNWVTGTAADWSSNSLNSYLDGIFELDARLQKNLKAFVSVDLSYYPMGQSQVQLTTPNTLSINPTNLNAVTTNSLYFLTTNSTVFTLKEMFVDLNIEKAVFFKIGKQVLQWGTTYFFTPNDLINVDHKTFADLNRVLNGTYGLKMQIPFGTTANLYGWIDGNDAITNLGDSAIAGKAEALLFGWEFSLSGWAKQGELPVYGFDFSGRIPWFNIDLYGEASMSYGQNAPIYYFTNKVSPILGTYNWLGTNYLTNTWIPKVVIGFTKTFEVLNIADRLSVTGEFYYNYSGYSNNMFQKATNLITNPLLQELDIAQLYSPNNYGQFYFALFTSFGEFINQDTTISLNALGNLSDMTFATTLDLSYNAVDRFTIDGNVTGYYGKGIGEYTYAGTAIAAQVNATVSF
jgi:hypothetical protein